MMVFRLNVAIWHEADVGTAPMSRVLCRLPAVCGAGGGRIVVTFTSLLT